MLYRRVYVLCKKAIQLNTETHMAYADNKYVLGFEEELPLEQLKLPLGFYEN
ncbi:Uncharacterised protein [Mycobacteroides abscessus subsp. abscessus]|nr:Uncharacterised protein [Mycobacteroides abscessus subsp. abscessus]